MRVIATYSAKYVLLAACYYFVWRLNVCVAVENCKSLQMLVLYTKDIIGVC